MAHTKTGRFLQILVAMSAALTLAGCGGGGTAKTATKEPKGIYTTGGDCADAGKLSYEDCAEAMAKAVQKHEKDSPTYAELRFCEAKEGDGKCEYTANQKYRPRLLAFLINPGTPPDALPLYAHPKGEDGFRDIGGTVYMHANEELVFSEHAQTMFERQNTKKRRR